MTPGDTFDVTAQDLCVPGYARKVRDVPEEMKREVYQEYGVRLQGPGDYEVDHLIPLEVGGSNSIKNLWPESHRTSPWNAQVKDRLEGKHHELVCSGQLKPNFQEKVLSLLCDFASEMQCDSPSWRDRRLQCMQRKPFLALLLGSTAISTLN